jgi:hypothetical protein
MQQPNTLSLTLAELYTVLGIAGALLGAATLYLRLSLSAALSKNKEEIINGIKVEFVTKEVIRLELREVNRRLDKVEGVGDSGIRRRREAEHE